MAERTKSPRLRVTRLDVIHATRTALAAMLSLALAKLGRLPESYWAPITTLVVMESTLGAELVTSGQRLIGTALGAILGALLAAVAPATIPVFGVAIFGT